MLVEEYGWAIQKRIKFLYFFTPPRIKKCLISLQNTLAFLTINHLQGESSI